MPAGAAVVEHCAATGEPIEVEHGGVRRWSKDSKLPVVGGFLGTVVRPLPHGRAGAREGSGRERRYAIVKVNTDALPELGDRCGIRSI